MSRNDSGSVTSKTRRKPSPLRIYPSRMARREKQSERRGNAFGTNLRSSLDRLYREYRFGLLHRRASLFCDKHRLWSVRNPRRTKSLVDIFVSFADLFVSLHRTCIEGSTPICPLHHCRSRETKRSNGTGQSIVVYLPTMMIRYTVPVIVENSNR